MTQNTKLIQRLEKYSVELSLLDKYDLDNRILNDALIVETYGYKMINAFTRYIRNYITNIAYSNDHDIVEIILLQCDTKYILSKLSTDIRNLLRKISCKIFTTYIRNHILAYFIVKNVNIPLLNVEPYKTEADILCVTVEYLLTECLQLID